MYDGEGLKFDVYFFLFIQYVKKSYLHYNDEDLTVNLRRLEFDMSVAFSHFL